MSRREFIGYGYSIPPEKLFAIGRYPFPLYRDKPDLAESFGTANNREWFTCDGIGLVITPPVGA